MTIREATEKDVPRLHALLDQVLKVHWEGRPDLFRAPGARKYTDEELRTILKDDMRPVFVAVDAQGVVRGYAFCAYVRREEHNILTDILTLYIDDLCVDEAWRAQGVGERLYRYVLEHARRTGCYNVTLNVWACNPRALAFYEKMGMKAQKIGMETIL